VGDDPQRTLGQYADAGGASARLGDLSLTLEDDVFRVEELSGHPDAS
jgi:hypothetical protein